MSFKVLWKLTSAILYLVGSNQFLSKSPFFCQEVKPVSPNQAQGHAGSAFAALRLQSTGSVVAVHRLRGSMVCGIFLGQGSNPCLLCWHADPLPLSHQGNPVLVVFRTNIISLALQVRLIIIQLLHCSTYATSFPTSTLYVPFNTPGNTFYYIHKVSCSFTHQYLFKTYVECFPLPMIFLSTW